MTPPELTTERLRLRPLVADDVDALVPIYTDPVITRYFAADVPDRAAVHERLRPGLNTAYLADQDGFEVELVAEPAEPTRITRLSEALPYTVVGCEGRRP